jgi:hypothetical protein
MGEATLENPDTPPAAVSKAARMQSIVSLCLVGLFLVTFVTVDLLARSDRVSEWFSRREMAGNARRGEIFTQRGAFFDDADYLWNQRIDKDDYSRGGVYLFGSSVALHSLDDWTLPASEARLIHNYGYSAASPAQAAQLVKFLVDERGLLAAGNDKTLIIIGLSYVDMVQPGSFKVYFEESLKRSGVYVWDADSGIQPVGRNSLVNFIKTERYRTRSFVLRCLGGQWHIRPKPFDAAGFRKENATRMNDDWQPALAESLGQTGSLLDELNSRHVAVVGLILPAGSWNQGIPSHEEYLAKMGALFAEKNVPIVDAEHSVPDEEYYDAVHCNGRGTARIQEIIEKIGVEFLRKAGTL